MAEELPERTYKHQVPAEVFVAAVTNTEWVGEKCKLFNQKYKEKYGIERLTGRDLKKQYSELHQWYFKFNDEYTLIYNTEIIDDDTVSIRFESYKAIAPHLIFCQSKMPGITINNCQWAEIDLETKEVENAVNFYIINSQITGSFGIGNSQIGNFNIYNNSKIDGFWFVNSQIGNFSIFNSQTGIFSIYKKSKIGDFSIYGNSKTDDFTIDQNSQIGDFDVSNSQIGYLMITASQTGNFKISNSQAGDYTVENSKTGNLNVERSIMGRFHVYNSNSPEWNILGIFAPFTFSKAIIGQCKLTNCNVTELRVENECCIELYANGGTIDHINFKQLTLGKNSIISFSSVKIFTCNMDNFVSLGYLYFRNIKNTTNTINFFDKAGRKPLFNKEFNTLWWNYYDKLTNFRHKIKLLKAILNEYKPTFRISQSSLGKTEFTECDLDTFNFEFNNSKITEVFISGGTLPGNVKIYDPEHNDNILKILKQKKSFFDQLKKVFEGQGDIIRGTKAHAKASKIQMKIIEQEKKKWWFKYFDTEWWVYKLNEISNQHGESWGWAVVFTLLTSLTGFIFYNHALEPTKYEFVHEWNTDYLGDWAQFILPTHKIEFMAEKPSSGAVFIDVLFRIFIGYGIYQLISAFRKHGKKV